MGETEDVLQSIDQLRRDLSYYHSQLKAQDDLAKHCENQRRRIGELEGLYEKVKAERDETATAFSKEHDRAEFLMRKNAELRELCADLYAEMITYSNAPSYNASVWAPKLREFGIEVDE